MIYFTATEIIEKLNATIPKNLMPKSGAISRQAFHKRKKEGKFKIYTKDNKEVFSWEEVAPTYGIKVESLTEKKDRLAVKDSEFNDLINSLEILLEDAVTPNQKVEVEKKFWESKIKELEYKEKVGELIPMEKIITVINSVMPVLKDKIYKIPSAVKTSYPDIDIDIIEDIHQQISLAFEQIQLHEFQ